MATGGVYRGVAGAALLAAAGFAPGSASLVQALELPRAVTLTLGDYAFSPAHIEVTAGTPVLLTLSNTDNLTPHNFSLRDADAGLDIDTDVGAGKSVTVQFTPRVAGSYTFYCNKKLPFMKSHRARGMEGTLTITRPAVP